MKLYLNSIHAELILRELIRDVDDPTMRPSSFNSNANYVIMKLSEAIMNSKSPSVSMGFEFLKRQFQSPELYYKDGNSLLDDLYFN